MDSQIAIERRDRVEEFRRKHRIGLLTLVFTDMVGSTRLKQAMGDTKGFERIQQHHDLVRGILTGFSESEEIGTAGDSFFIVFAKPSEAVSFALLLQARLRETSRDGSVELSDRIGIHIGEVIIEERPGSSKPKDLYGIQVDICARVMSLGQGDQILMTRSTFDNARQVLKGQELADLGPLTWASHGTYLLQGVDEPLEVCEVGETGRACLNAPPDSGKARRAESSRSGAGGGGTERGSLQARRWFAALGFIVILGVVIAAIMHRSRGTAETLIFRCGFEPGEGYRAGEPLSGRSGWRRGGWQGQLPDVGEGVAAGLLPGSSQQAFVGGVSGADKPQMLAAVSRSIAYSADPQKNAVVEIDVKQMVTDSTKGGRNIFEWVIYNQQGNLLCGLNFDNSTCKIMSRRFDNSLAETGMSFERGRAYDVRVRLDFRSNTWSAVVGDKDLASQTLAGRNQPLNLGNIALTWRSGLHQAVIPGVPLAGDNRIVIDDLKITAKH